MSLLYHANTFKIHRSFTRASTNKLIGIGRTEARAGDGTSERYCVNDTSVIVAGAATLAPATPATHTLHQPHHRYTNERTILLCLQTPQDYQCFVMSQRIIFLL